MLRVRAVLIVPASLPLAPEGAAGAQTTTRCWRHPIYRWPITLVDSLGRGSRDLCVSKRVHLHAGARVRVGLNGASTTSSRAVGERPRTSMMSATAVMIDRDDTGVLRGEVAQRCGILPQAPRSASLW